jgi:toxin YoeB
VRVVFEPSAWEEFIAWTARNPATARKIIELIQDIRRSPFVGLGKPEPLTGDWQHWWSRRIDSEHRLVYSVSGTKGDDQRLTIAQCRGHY